MFSVFNKPLILQCDNLYQTVLAFLDLMKQFLTDSYKVLPLWYRFPPEVLCKTPLIPKATFYYSE